MSTNKSIVLVSTGMVFALASFGSTAHMLSGRLGALPDAKARYSVNCAENRTQLVTRIAARTKRDYVVELTVTKAGEVLLNPDASPSNSVRDPKSGDKPNEKTGKGYSQISRLAQGPGNYIMEIGKVKKTPTQKDAKLKGAMVFNVELHCQDPAGNHSAGDTEVFPY